MIRWFIKAGPGLDALNAENSVITKVIQRNTWHFRMANVKDINVMFAKRYLQVRRSLRCICGDKTKGYRISAINAILTFVATRRSRHTCFVIKISHTLFAITATSFSSVWVAYGIIFGVSLARRRFATMSAISPTPRQNLFVNIGYRFMEHFKTMSATTTTATKPTDILLTFGTIKQVFTTRKATCVLSVKNSKDPLRISTNISRNIRERLLMHANSQDVTQNSCTHTSFSNIVSIANILNAVLVSITSTQLWIDTNTKQRVLNMCTVNVE